MIMDIDDKKLHKFMFASFILIFIIWAIFMFWWIYPYKTFILNRPYRILTPLVEQGGLFIYEIDYCKYTEVDANVNRKFVDGLEYVMPEIKPNFEKGCYIKIQTIKIPENLPPNTYHLKIQVDYKMNPIRTITHKIITTNFTVVKK